MTPRRSALGAPLSKNLADTAIHASPQPQRPDVPRATRAWPGRLAIQLTVGLGCLILGTVTSLAEEDRAGEGRVGEGSAGAADASSASETHDPSTDRVRGHGLRAFVDPATGELTSQPSEAQLEAHRQLLESSALDPEKALERALDRSTEGLVPFSLPFGGRGVFLDGRFQSATVVRVTPGGELEMHCTVHPEGHESPHEHLALEGEALAPGDLPPGETAEDETWEVR